MTIVGGFSQFMSCVPKATVTLNRVFVPVERERIFEPLPAVIPLTFCNRVITFDCIWTIVVESHDSVLLV